MQQNPLFKVFMDINHHKSIFRQSPPSFGFAKTTNNSCWLVPKTYPRPWGSTSFWGMTMPLLLFTPVNGGRTTPCGKYNLQRISVALRITLWLFNIAIENGPVEIVDFPINSMVIFHSFLLTFTRG